MRQADGTRHIFGYGSLVNSATHAYAKAHPARLHGWERCWQHTTRREVAFLNVRPAAAPDAAIDGLVLEVPAHAPELDARERAYARLEVSPRPLTSAHGSQASARGPQASAHGSRASARGTQASARGSQAAAHGSLESARGSLESARGSLESAPRPHAASAASLDEAPARALIFAIPPEERPSPPRAPRRACLLLSYIDVVVQGYLREFGEEGVQRFFESTRGWDAPLIDDRARPRYPRAQALSRPERALVDHFLKRLGALRRP